MKIFVTGGAGYIGSHTTLELLRAGHDVIVVDNLINSHEEALRRVMDLAGKSLTFHRVDLLDRDALAAGAVGVIASSGNIIVSQMSEVFRLVFEEHDLIQAREKFDVMSGQLTGSKTSP